MFTDFKSLEKKHNFESKIRQIHVFFDFVGTQRHEGKRDLNGQITSLTSKITEIQRETLLPSSYIEAVFIKKNSNFERNCKIKVFELLNLVVEKYV